jgi:hypothetical protein
MTMKNGKINETLKELIVGIGIVGVVIQVIELLVAAFYPEFAGSKLSFAIGLWIGVFTAVFLAVHMYRSIDTALDMQPDDAEKYMRKAYFFSDCGNPDCGVSGLFFEAWVCNGDICGNAYIEVRSISTAINA